MEKIRGLKPIVPKKARLLILGSMPSETSLRLKQYYGHKTNQFWRVVSSLLGVKPPINYREKVRMLKEGRIALWDVIASCRRHKSSDGSIKEVAPNNIVKLLRENRTIRLVLLNGKTAEKYFKDHFSEKAKAPFYYVPSTSTAHAGLNLNKKILLWRKAFNPNTLLGSVKKE